jgi:hypothetical protein
MTQTDLFTYRSKKTIEERVLVMVGILETHRVIPVCRFKARLNWSDRTCRAIANASEGRIIATQKGYVLSVRSTQEEFNEANGRIYSQARNMMRRALKERSVRHKSIGVTQ